MLARRCVTGAITRGHPTLCALSRQNRVASYVKSSARFNSTVTPNIPNTVPPPAPSGSLPRLNVNLSCNETAIGQHSLVHVAVDLPSEGLARPPCDICCVIDVSGSMETEAYVTNSTGAVERHGLTILDVVKHAVRTLAQSMSPDDRLAVVVYATTAQVLSDLRPMDDDAKRALENTLDLLNTRDSTNIWDGLDLGAGLLLRGAQPGRVSSMFLLTDGLANISPPRGEVAQFQKLKESRKIPFSLNTFGFGYEGIDSELLHKLAVEGNGMFSFIPDSSMVGTVFVNAIANAYVSVSNNAQLTFSTNGNTSFDSTFGKQKTKVVGPNTQFIEACSVQIGQSKDFLFAVSPSSPSPSPSPSSSSPSSPPFPSSPSSPPPSSPNNGSFEYSVEFSHNIFQDPTPSKVTVNSSQAKLQRRHLDTEFHHFRLQAVEALLEARSNYNLSCATAYNQAPILSVINSILASKTTDPRTLALLEDLKGQALLAVDNNRYYSRWGKHYLLALARAHQLQFCSNFKDPGVQVYGGTLFKQIRDSVEELYLRLPPPKPTGRPYMAGTFSMNSYYDPSRPCFDGDCSVLMGDGSLQKVKNIKKGDKVRTPSGKSVEVECVVKTLCARGDAMLCDISRTPDTPLLITPYHPVRIAGAWRFPCDLAPARRRACAAVYSFLLRAEHAMYVGGVECVTLAHGFEDCEVVRHAYFGTTRVVDDLKKCRGWANGLIVFGDGCLVRDKETGLVCGLQNELNIAAA